MTDAAKSRIYPAIALSEPPHRSDTASRRFGLGYLRRRVLGADIEVQTAMGDSQRRFDIRGDRSPGEDEPQVARPIGRRCDDLAGLRRDRHPGDPGYRL